MLINNFIYVERNETFNFMYPLRVMAVVVQIVITSEEVGNIIAVQIGLMRINSSFAHSHLNWMKLIWDVQFIQFEYLKFYSPPSYLGGERERRANCKGDTFLIPWWMRYIQFSLAWFSYTFLKLHKLLIFPWNTLHFLCSSYIQQSHIEIRRVVIHLFLLRKCHLFFFVSAHSFEPLLLFRPNGEYCVLFSVLMSLVSKIAERFCYHSRCIGNCFEFREFESVQWI